MAEAQTAVEVGTRVRIERDETRYPSRGTWPRFRGKTGTVVQVNVDRKRPHLTEYGVSLGKVTARTDGRGALNWESVDVVWFKVYELTPIPRGASQRAAGSGLTRTRYEEVAA